MSLQRMIVIPGDTFERWKKIVTEDKKLSNLDREMKKILFNNKLNDVSKWHFYRQNLLKYLNTKRRHNNVATQYLDANIQTDPVKYKHKKLQTLKPDVNSIGTQVTLMKPPEELPSIEEVFGSQNRFSSLEDESNTTGEDELLELDMDDYVRNKALEGQPSSVKIFKERASLDPNEYRLFELNNGDTVNVPVEKQMITRSTLKRGRLPDATQTTLAFAHRKKKLKQSSTSTPIKSKKDVASSIPWKKL